MKKSALSSTEVEHLRMSLQTTVYISSDETVSESDGETDDDDTDHPLKTLAKKSLLWRSDFLNRNYNKLDMMAKRRNYGGQGYHRIDKRMKSTRLAPLDWPDWAVKSE